jgi:hypothetical protein
MSTKNYQVVLGRRSPITAPGTAQIFGGGARHGSDDFGFAEVIAVQQFGPEMAHFALPNPPQELVQRKRLGPYK